MLCPIPFVEHEWAQHPSMVSKHSSTKYALSSPSWVKCTGPDRQLGSTLKLVKENNRRIGDDRRNVCREFLQRCPIEQFFRGASRIMHKKDWQRCIGGARSKCETSWINCVWIEIWREASWICLRGTNKICSKSRHQSIGWHSKAPWWQSSWFQGIVFSSMGPPANKCCIERNNFLSKACCFLSTTEQKIGLLPTQKRMCGRSEFWWLQCPKIVACTLLFLTQPPVRQQKTAHAFFLSQTANIRQTTRRESESPSGVFVTLAPVLYNSKTEQSKRNICPEYFSVKTSKKRIRLTSKLLSSVHLQQVEFISASPKNIDQLPQQSALNVHVCGARMYLELGSSEPMYMVTAHP